MNIRKIVNETARGCGFRKPGGIYLVTDPGPLFACGRLPVPLCVCPVCGSGIRQARGWTWVDGQRLFTAAKCRHPDKCGPCPLHVPGPEFKRMGLIWVGERFYKSPGEFTFEAMMQGISRRIAAVPRGFEIGKTWVGLAHRRGMDGEDGKPAPALFHVFRPQRMEYILTGNETPAELESLEARGFTLVLLERTT